MIEKNIKYMLLVIDDKNTIVNENLRISYYVVEFVFVLFIISLGVWTRLVVFCIVYVLLFLFV